MMTLDEAIKHCEEVAEENECIAHSLTKDGWQEHFNNLTQEKEVEYKNVREEMANSCLECAAEHRQLASWLKELKAYRKAEKEIEQELVNWNDIDNGKCRGLFLATSIIQHYKDEEVNADADSD